ncbi:MAG: hypothetical protein ACP5IB_09840 [Thermoplasmata archaeon]
MENELEFFQILPKEIYNHNGITKIKVDLSKLTADKIVFETDLHKDSLKGIKIEKTENGIKILLDTSIVKYREDITINGIIKTDAKFWKLESASEAKFEVNIILEEIKDMYKLKVQSRAKIGIFKKLPEDFIRSLIKIAILEPLYLYALSEAV